MNKRFLLSLLVVVVASLSVTAQGIKYVFYFIGDGMGVNQVNGTEMYLAEMEGRIGIENLCFTQFPVATLVNTYSRTNSVTDSAAGGTALACGEKTSNGTIGMNTDHTSPLYSVAQWAKNSGAAVGVATSVSVDHATPAAFYAHQPDRDMYYEIACQIPEAGFDFYAGSGFLSPETSFDKKKKKSVFDILPKKGYQVVEGVDAFRACKNKDKVVLLEKGGRDESLSLAINRKSGDMTLKDITECAISSLYGKSDKGFFVMIEGGLIDWACHANDAASVFNEVIDMDNAVKVAYEFYKQHPDETLILVTADHETGGIVLGNGPYVLDLKLLANQKVSVDKLSGKISEMKNRGNVSWDELKQVLKENLGFWDTVTLTDSEESELHKAYEDAFVDKDDRKDENMYSSNEHIAALAVRILNAKAHVSWASGGHSAGFVPLFAIGKGSDAFSGQTDNIKIAHKIAELAGYNK